MMAGPTRDFWREKFQASDTPWDRGEVHPQLRRWTEDKSLAPCNILVPGCGSGHEVAFLATMGCKVTAIDFAPEAVQLTRGRLSASGQFATVEEADVLAWGAPSPFDAVYEQTCLCALHPDLWVGYAAQLRKWLRPGGTMFALFMQVAREGAADGFVEGPPYHCDVNAMRALFPKSHWEWGKPPFVRTAHPKGIYELGVILTRSH